MSASPARLAWPAAVMVAWLLAWWHLAADWSADEQYRYGFGVPFLAAWMAWRRFGGPMAPAPRGPAWWGVIAITLLLLAMGEALRWHDPLWRLTGAALAAGAALLSIAWLHRTGGVPLVRRELFPLFFMATAVPWPVPVELWTVSHLAGAVTDVAVSAANLLGVAALQHGNTIELANGVVGVDEACSGIQSLQSIFMASLFLGEFFSLRTTGRVALVVAGAAISFITNCGRVLALTMLAHTRGPAGTMEWHDTVGGSATFCAFGLLLAAAVLLPRSPAAAPSAKPRTAPVHLPEGIAIFAMLLAIPVAGRVWFSQFETGDTPSAKPSAWIVSDSHLPSGWSATFIAPSKPARASLRFSEWQAFHVRDPAGTGAQVVRLAWKSGARLPSFVTSHTPAVCMPSAGWAQSAPPFLLTLKIHGADLPCAAYPFSRDGTRLLALQSLSAGGRPETRLVDPAQIPGTFRRLTILWEAPLRQITEELLLYLPDPGDDDARKTAATAILEAVLQHEGR